MDLNDLVATNLRRARNARALSQEELADKCGLSARYVGSIERGKASPTITVIARVAAALEIDPRDLFEGWLKKNT